MSCKIKYSANKASSRIDVILPQVTVTDQCISFAKNVMTPYPEMLLENARFKRIATIDKDDIEEYSLYLILRSFTNTCRYIQTNVRDTSHEDLYAFLCTQRVSWSCVTHYIFIGVKNILNKCYREK
jgi:hypothetical protein